ncbi:MAG: glycosyl hydrolase [Gemmatimonadales bacterium]
MPFPTVRLLPAAAVLVLVATPAAAQRRTARPAAPPALDPAWLDGLTWRNVGPFRGGRATTITGVPGQPMVYYFGATGGGIWKTDDAGATWKPIADGQLRMGSVGSIAVAAGDPAVIYAGTGEAPVRGVSSSFGDGMYKSTDAGKTWRHTGLAGSRTISRVLVHPRNADLVYVAAQGSRWGPSAERGVYRSTNGGSDWKLVLSGDSLTGPADLAMDPSNPRILYAAMWDAQRTPWFARSGGPGSGIWKSVDGGDSWTRLTRGLPALMGKIGLAVSAADPNRIWAIVEADAGGLYRSDDAGASWTLVNGDRVLHARAWYYMRVTADPANRDLVYVINAPVLKSIDGGKSFTELADPHGDNHDVWINPANPANLAKADDGGGVVSFNGGVTWSSQMNQPTAQFYRVSVDDRYPYWLYSGQQDNSSVAIPSAVTGPGIGNDAFRDAGGCESAHVAFDPADPRYLYANCYGGIITEYDRDLGQARNVMAYPFLGLGEPSDKMKYRWNWSSPIITSPHDRKVIYHGGNVLFRSNDRGQSWTAVSPDLTRNDRSRQGPGGGPITNEGAGGEVYNTIYYVAESPVQQGVLWVGTDDGLVQLTRDGGRTWANVTPAGLAESLINMVEPSTRSAGTALIAVSRYKWNDNTPLVFRTTDFGATWTPFTAGLPAGEIVRVVREDPEREGLLYAGTETGFWVSSGGGPWQRLQLNLPHVPITDIRVHHGDLVIATEGRAFWILDDITPVRDLAGGSANSPVLFPIRTAVRTFLGSNAPPPPGMGRNAPQGAIISFRIADTSAVARLEMLDGTGKAVRTYASDAKPPAGRLAIRSGFNRMVWDLRGEGPTRVEGLGPAGGGASGYRLAPGRYQARLTTGDAVLTQSFEVVADPRTRPAPAAVAEQQRALGQVWGRVDEINRRANQLRSVRQQVKALVERVAARADADTIRTTAEHLTAAIDSVELLIINPRIKTFQDVINFRNGLSDQYQDLAGAIDGTDEPVTAGMRERLADLDGMWREQVARIDRILGAELGAFNALVRGRDVPAIILPERGATP